jgi:hypothetical protein
MKYPASATVMGIAATFSTSITLSHIGTPGSVEIPTTTLYREFWVW